MGQSFAQDERRKRSPSDPPVFPQWVMDTVRPIGHALSRVLWNIRYVGLENVPLHGGLILAANHQTYIDPFWIGFPIDRPMRFLAWDEAFSWPMVGKLMGLLGAWPLQVEKSDPAAIRLTLRWLRGGGAVMIFPEGGRCLPDGALCEFKAGAARIALEAGVPILPVTIRGGHRVWPRGYRFPHLAKVEIIYHPPHHLTQHKGEDTRACARRETERLTEIIRSKL
ncbi:MAG: lysophospholipid acyltransferase family protein [Pyrinomonadaceae bacterium]